jgi:hypothetical protein
MKKVAVSATPAATASAKVHPFLCSLKGCGGLYSHDINFRKLFAISFLVLGAGFLATAIFKYLNQGFGKVSTPLFTTFGCIGLPFFLFGVWCAYLELKPYDPHTPRETKK